MTIELPLVVGMLSTALDQTTRHIVLTVETADRATYQIHFDAALVAAVARSLLSIGRSFACGPGGRAPEQPPTPIDGAVPCLGPEGQKVLDLLLANGAHFPVTFPAHAIPILQGALQALDAMGSEAASPAPMKH